MRLHKEERYFKCLQFEELHQRDLKCGELLNVTKGLQQRAISVIICAFILEEDTLSCANVRPYLCSL